MIKELYGKTIKVRLEMSEDGQTVTRRVKEDLSRAHQANDDEANENEYPNEQSVMMYS